MQQFAALGYIEDPTADKEKAAESADIENKYNLARTYLWKNRPDQALPLLEEIVGGGHGKIVFLPNLLSVISRMAIWRRQSLLLTAIVRRPRARFRGHETAVGED